MVQIPSVSELLLKCLHLVLSCWGEGCWLDKDVSGGLWPLLFLCTQRLIKQSSTLVKINK